MASLPPPTFADELPDVVLFPAWNKHVTAAQRFHELALMAEKHPDRFQKVFVGWIGERDNKSYNNDVSLNMTTTEQAGWLSYWIHCMHKRTSKDYDD